MLKLLKCLILLLCLQPLVLFAQNKTFTLEDIFKNRDLFPKSMTNLQWVGASHNYSYVKNNLLLESSVGKQEDQTIVDLDKLNGAVQSCGGESLKSFPAVQWIDTTAFWFLTGNDLYVYKIAENKVAKMNSGGKDAVSVDVAPKTLNLAYLNRNNLYVSIDGKNRQVTNDPDTGIVNGQIVHRNEWGIDKGTFWSPAGDLLAFYHMDQSMVTQYPLVDIEPRPAEVKYKRYPMAGMTSHQVTIGVYDPKNKKTVWLETGEPRDQFLTNITWTPDEKYILVAVLNREQDHMWLRQYDAATGKLVKTLFEENDAKYVEPLHGPVFLNTNPVQFIWQSRRDGYNHLYLYDLTGQMIRQITSGKWDVIDFTGIEGDDKAVWFVAGIDKPINRNIYRVDMKTKKVSMISTEAGTHSPDFTHDNNLYLDNFSGTGMASRISICDKNGKQIKELLKDENPLSGYKTGNIKIFTLKSVDSSDLYCRIIKPPDFDSTKRYPLLIYVYGGPHSQMVTNTWLAGGGLYLDYLATQGYVIFTMDNHGTSNRGKAFEQIIHRQVGVEEVKDQMIGVDYLKSLSYVDSKRIGVYGWSYGGFITLSMLVQHPDDFKMGVAGGPVCDWKYYEVMYGERYMDTPQENPDGYERTSLLNQAEKLKASLLIIHGTMDETVVWQNSLQFLKKCIDNGILVDYFVYPGHEHNVSGKDRLHLFRKIEQYVKEKL